MATKGTGTTTLIRGPGGNPTGPSQQVTTSFADADLNVIALTDPTRVEALVTSMADQINAARSSQPNPKRCIDLADHITDIIIETTVQGASVLEVYVIDPGWTLLARDSSGVSFIDTDAEGYLWPPIEVNFPPDVSDAKWRLCACNPSTDLSGPNITLTFEDASVSQLREHLGPLQSNPNETRAEFIQRLIKLASTNKLIQDDTGLRFVSLLPKSTFTSADLTADEAKLPASATAPDAPKARKNPNKKATAGKATATSTPVATRPSATLISIAEGPNYDPIAGSMPPTAAIPGLGNS